MDESIKWLPVPTSRRTISVAKHRFPIHLAYDGRGIGMVFGIAPVEPDETGVVHSSNFRAKNRHDRWENPLKLAFHYRDLMRKGRTKAEIAIMSGISRARVTQVMNLLNLHPEIQEYMNKVGHNLDAKLITERRLREISLIQDSNEQLNVWCELVLC